MTRRTLGAALAVLLVALTLAAAEGTGVEWPAVALVGAVLVLGGRLGIVTRTAVAERIGVPATLTRGRQVAVAPGGDSTVVGAASSHLVDPGNDPPPSLVEFLAARDETVRGHGRREAGVPAFATRRRTGRRSR